MIGRRKLLLAASALSVLASCSHDLTRLGQRPVEQLAKDLGVCSAAYAVLRSGRPNAVVPVAGCASVGGGAAEGIYQAASLTKPVVAFAALRLAIEGQLDLGAPVAHYLPGGYPHFHDVLARAPSDTHDVVPAAMLSRMSVRSLLNHSSGLPNWTRGKLALQFEPGQRWDYSGEGFMLLQAVIEAVTGQDLSTHCNRQVFSPLGMVDSSLVWREALAPRFVSGTARFMRPRELRFRSPVAAASLCTTASDYAMFMSTLLGDERVLQRVLTDPIAVDAALGLQWGLGWGIAHAEGGPYLWQWGNNPGYRAFAMASVRSRDGFVLFTNSEQGMPLAASVANSVLPSEHRVFRFPWVA